MNDWSLSEEEMGLKQWAEMLTNMFVDPSDTAEAEAAPGPCAVKCCLPNPSIGAMSLQPAKPTTHPSPGSRSAGRGEKERAGAWGSPASSSPA